MADVKSLEHPTLKVSRHSLRWLNLVKGKIILVSKWRTNFYTFQQVPYELLNKKFRAAQKTLDREVSHVQAAALDLEKGLQDESVGAGEISRLLGGMVERLQVFKRKVFLQMFEFVFVLVT